MTTSELISLETIGSFKIKDAPSFVYTDSKVRTVTMRPLMAVLTWSSGEMISAVIHGVVLRDDGSEIPWQRNKIKVDRVTAPAWLLDMLRDNDLPVRGET